mgnify:CR=1 FL=1
MKKRFIATLLAFTMLLSCVCVSSFAVENTKLTVLSVDKLDEKGQTVQKNVAQVSNNDIIAVTFGVRAGTESISACDYQIKINYNGKALETWSQSIDKNEEFYKAVASNKKLVSDASLWLTPTVKDSSIGCITVAGSYAAEPDNGDYTTLNATASAGESIDVVKLAFKVKDQAESGKLLFSFDESYSALNYYCKVDAVTTAPLEFECETAGVDISGKTPELSEVTLNVSNPITVNGTTGATVTATAASAQGTNLTEKVTWSVAPTDNGVSIDATTGTIAVGAKAEAGEYTITATGDDTTATGSANATLKVERAAETYTVTVTSANLQLTVPTETETSSSQFFAAVKDQYDERKTDATVTWSVEPSDKGVSVDQNGLVTVSADAKGYVTGDESQSFTVKAAYTDAIYGTETLTVARATANAAKVEISGKTTELLVPANGATVDASASYTVTVTDQYDATIESPSVTWSISPEVEGISINETTGVVTVTNAAKNTITNTDGMVFVATAKCGEAADTKEITIKRDSSKIAEIEVSGVGEIIVPDKSATEDATAQFTVAAKDQYGADISDPSVTWSIIRNGITEPVTGVSIDQSGKVTVTKAAKDHVGVNDNNSFYVRAASSANPEVFGAKDVDVKRAASVVTSMTVAAADATNNFVVPAGTEAMAINLTISEIKDQYGDSIRLSEAVQWTAIDGVEFTQASESNDFSSYVANINTAKMLARFGDEQRDKESVKITFTAKYDNTEQCTDVTFTLASAEPTSIVLTSNPTGDDIVIPTGDTPNTKTYTATVKDQYGFAMNDAKVTYEMASGDEKVTFNDATATVGIAEGAKADQPYTVTATCGTATASHTFTVKNKKLHAGELDVAQANFTYSESGKLNPSATLDGNKVTASYTYTDSNNQNVETTPTNAGTYTVTARYETATDIYTGKTTFTIGQKSLTSDMLIVSGTYTYTGAEQAVNYEVKDGDLLTANDYTITGTRGQNAGTYTVAVTGKGNYTGTVTKTWIITPATLMASISGTVSKTYDGKTAITASTVNVTLSGVFDPDVVTAVVKSADFDGTDVGNHKVTAMVELDGAAKDNYVLAASTIEAQGTITQAYHENVTANMEAKYGNTAELDLTTVGLPTGYVLGTPVVDTNPADIFDGSVTLSGSSLSAKLTSDATKAGKTATIKILVSSTNYADYTITVTVTVAAKDVQTITASNIRATYGDTGVKVNATAVGALNYSVISGDDVIDIDASGNVTIKKAGEATIKISAAETNDYAAATKDITVTIAKRTLTVKAADKSAYIGEKLPELTYEVSGLVGSDKLTKEPTLEVKHAADVDPMKKVGEYEIGFKVAPAASANYELTTATGKLTVSVRPVYVGPIGSPVEVGRSDNGTVTVSPANAAKGTTVTITANPGKGQELKSLEVIDQNGNSLPLTDLGNGKFSFVMPAGKVTVKPVFGAADAYRNPYADVQTNDWYFGAVQYVTENGLMNGTGNGFEPNLATSRAMIWTILARMSDVNTASSGEWYAVAQQWAIANGVSDGTMPNGTITREQLAAMLYRYAVSKGMVKGPATADLSVFADANSVSNYAVEAMQWAVSTGLIGGMDGKLNPQGSATRAQVATMLMRFAELEK